MSSTTQPAFLLVSKNMAMHGITPSPSTRAWKGVERHTAVDVGGAEETVLGSVVDTTVEELVCAELCERVTVITGVDGDGDDDLQDVVCGTEEEEEDPGAVLTGEVLEATWEEPEVPRGVASERR